MFRQSSRISLYGLKVVRVTTYEGKVHHEMNILKWRYALEREEDGHKFVYTGQQQLWREGDVINIKATVKVAMDSYGYTRLSIPKHIEPEGPKLI